MKKKMLIIIASTYVFAGCTTTTYEPPDLEGPNIMGNIRKMQTLEKDLFSPVSSENQHSNYDEVVKLASGLVYLSDGIRVYSPQKVFLCPSLKRNELSQIIDFTCDYLQPDSTENFLTTSSEHTTTVPFRSENPPYFRGPSNWFLQTAHFRLLGDPVLVLPVMMNTAAQFDWGSVNFTSIRRVNDNTFLMFAILKGQGDSFYKKFVWILQEEK